MRWTSGRRSENVEDRRGMGGGGGGRMVMGGGLGIGGVLLVLLIMYMGGDPGAILQQAPQNQQVGVQQQEFSPEEEQLKDFVSVVLADTEDVWTELFRKSGREYRKPTLVLFSGQVESGCGFASAASGPFYCPADQKLYIDLAFYNMLRDRFGAPGDFAQAYVIAHEVGHHVQNLLGTMDEVQALKGRVSETEYNQLSVKLELQADFYAGVWAHHAHKARDILEQGDIEEGLRAASAIGDDALQKQSQGYVVPDSFTHGSSAQRVFWFKKGLQTGDLRQGDTFNARE